MSTDAEWFNAQLARIDRQRDEADEDRAEIRKMHRRDRWLTPLIAGAQVLTASLIGGLVGATLIHVCRP